MKSFKEYTIDETKLSDTIQGITDKLDAIKYNNTPSQRQKRKEEKERTKKEKKYNQTVGIR